MLSMKYYFTRSFASSLSAGLGVLALLLGSGCSLFGLGGGGERFERRRGVVADTVFTISAKDSHYQKFPVNLTEGDKALGWKIESVSDDGYSYPSFWGEIIGLFIPTIAFQTMKEMERKRKDGAPRVRSTTIKVSLYISRKLRNLTCGVYREANGQLVGVPISFRQKQLKKKKIGSHSLKLLMTEPELGTEKKYKVGCLESNRLPLAYGVLEERLKKKGGEGFSKP